MLTEKTPKNIPKIAKYFTVGGIGFVIEIVSFYLMIKILNIFYLVASPISTAFSIVTMYYLHRNWTFNSTSPKIAKQFAIFSVVAILAVFFNTLLTAFFVEVFAVGKISSKTMAIVILSAWNFFFHHKITFKDEHKPSSRYKKTFSESN